MSDIAQGSRVRLKYDPKVIGEVMAVDCHDAQLKLDAKTLDRLGEMADLQWFCIYDLELAEFGYTEYRGLGLLAALWVGLGILIFLALRP